MRSFMYCLCLAVFLPSCTHTTRDLQLAGLNLNDPRVVARVQDGLPAQERGTFALYALTHWPLARSFCGENLTDQSGSLPETVGDAVAFTIDRQRRDMAAAERNRPKSRGDAILAKRDEQISERDAIVARIQVARSQPKNFSSSDLRNLEEELEKIDRRLAKTSEALALSISK